MKNGQSNTLVLSCNVDTGSIYLPGARMQEKVTLIYSCTLKMLWNAYDESLMQAIYAIIYVCLVHCLRLRTLLSLFSGSITHMYYIMFL